MQTGLTRLLLVVAVLIALAVLAWAAWGRVAPALEDGWLSYGMAAKVFLPVLILGAVILWRWRR